MDPQAAREFLGQHHRGVLATMRADGLPQLSPVTVVPGPDGRIWISTRQTAVKTRNVRRDPRVTVCAFMDSFFGKWITVSGTATVLALPEALEALVTYYRIAAGEHDDWDAYRAAMVEEQRCLLQIEIARAGPDS